MSKNCGKPTPHLTLGPQIGNKQLAIVTNPDGSTQTAMVGHPDLLNASEAEGGRLVTLQRCSENDTTNYHIVGGGEHSGPPMVSTPAYREGWDRTFKKGLPN